MAAALGYRGFAQYASLTGETRSSWDIFYLTVQLFTMESGLPPQGQTPVSLPLELEISRLLAPAVAAYAAVQAFIVIFSGQIRLLRLRWLSNHVVICGLGRKGLLLARDFGDHDYHVVVIEKDPLNEAIQRCHERSMAVLVGDATDRELLDRAGAGRAKYLIAVCGDDGINAEIAIAARGLAKNRRGKALTCIVHIVDPALSDLLSQQSPDQESPYSFWLEFFNIFDAGARALLEQDEVAKDQRGIPADLLVFGLGHLGQRLVVQAAKRWVSVAGAPEERRITVVDRNAARIVDSLYRRYPQVKAACVLTPVSRDPLSAESVLEWLDSETGRQAITRARRTYVCIDNDSSALSLALMLLPLTRESGGEIVVCHSREGGLATLLEGYEGLDHDLANLSSFGLLDRTSRHEILVEGPYEKIARAVQERYRRMSTPIQPPAGRRPTIRAVLDNVGEMFAIAHAWLILGERSPRDPHAPWESLWEEFKESSRSQARDMGNKLRRIGYGIEPLIDPAAKTFQFSPEEVEEMAKMEHCRWVTERRRQGWKPGAKRDSSKKITPYFLPWDEDDRKRIELSGERDHYVLNGQYLPEEIKQIDRDFVADIPGFLFEAGFQIYRLGQTGVELVQIW